MKVAYSIVYGGKGEPFKYRPDTIRMFQTQLRKSESDVVPFRDGVLDGKTETWFYVRASSMARIAEHKVLHIEPFYV